MLLQLFRGINAAMLKLRFLVNLLPAQHLSYHELATKHLFQVSFSSEIQSWLVNLSLILSRCPMIGHRESISDRTIELDRSSNQAFAVKIPLISRSELGPIARKQIKGPSSRMLKLMITSEFGHSCALRSFGFPLFFCCSFTYFIFIASYLNSR